MAVKCVVWDLDNTLWDGILLEDSEVSLRPSVPGILKTLDERGILHSIASRNDRDSAFAKLREAAATAFAAVATTAAGHLSRKTNRHPG